MAKNYLRNIKKLFDMKTLTINFSTGYLNKYSHIKIGGLSKYIFRAKKLSDISLLYQYVKDKKDLVIPVGGGSNILFGNTNDLIILPDKWLKKYIVVKGEDVRVSANININELIIKAAEYNLGGLEFLSGIPAHIGGTVFMNAGAYGSEIFDFVTEIKLIDWNGNDITLKKEEINFGYRYTKIKGFIYEVTFKLIHKTKELIKKEITEFIEKRKKTQPLEYPNLGSTFKNPSNNYAAKMLELCGLKGMKIGDAQFSEKHSNFIVNLGNATFEDVNGLINYAIEKVYEKFNVILTPEIRIVEWQKR